MKAEEVAACIGQGRERRSGDGWMAPCPAHDDRNPSCSISEGRDGVTLVLCHAGCDTEAVLAVRNLTMSDLFPEGRAPRDDRPRIACAYPYHDEAGVLLYEVVRKSPKGDFPVRTPNGRGGWNWKLNGARRVPYRLPELRAAAAAGGTVFVCEGEKDADAIVREGEVATTNPFGAGKWDPGYAEHFRGVNEVFIVCDRDGPGYRHGRDVANSLAPVVQSVTVAAPRSGKDVSDHVVAGHSLDELEVLSLEELDQLCADEPKATVPNVTVERVTSEGTKAEPTPALFRRYSMPDLLAEPDEFEWLVGGLLPAPTYGQAAGEMKTLKSTIAGFIEVGLASGNPVFGKFYPPAQRPVVAYVGEGGRRLWTRRIRRICSAMGLEPGDLDLHPVFDVAPIPSLLFQESLQRDLVEIQPGLVTLDPLYTYHGVATRAADLHQEGALLNQLSAPCMDAGASLLVVNHFNQGGAGTSLKRITMAGSGEWADSWLLVAHREEPHVEAGSFRLTLEVGSRQWGGTTWDLDLDIGRFDEDSGCHDGQISWDLRRSDGGRVRDEKATAAELKAQTAILDSLADMPWKLTKTELKLAVGGSRATFAAAHDTLVSEGRISHHMTRRSEAGVDKTRPLWGLAPNPAESERPGWFGEAE